MEGRARRENGGGGGGPDCRWNCSTSGKDCLTLGLKTADGEGTGEGLEEMEEKVEEMMVKEGEDYYMEMGEEEDLSGEYE
jgi:hypothetical protein